MITAKKVGKRTLIPSRADDGSSTSSREPLWTRSGDQHARLRARGGGRRGPPGEARNLPAGGKRRGVPTPIGEAGSLCPRSRRGPGGISVPGAVAARSALRAERPGMAARIVRSRRAGAGRGRGLGALAGARLRLRDHARPLRRRPGRPFPPESRRGADGRLRTRLRDHLPWRLGGSASDLQRGRQCHERAEDQTAHSLSTARFTSRTMGSGRSGPALGCVMIAQLIGTESPADALASRVDASGTT